MNRVAQFVEFIESNKLLKLNDATLLAVSGGMDSIAMTHLFHSAEFKFAIAHCNFGLRGNDSDEDEIFCRNLAEKYNVSFFSIKFDTVQHAKNTGLSMQTAARELRYDWLEEIREKNNFDCIATAHHLDDNAETMLFNISRGAGYAGISGIPLINKNVVRPLMVFQKSDITEFATDSNLVYREDVSNSAKYYSRNKIRYDVIPHLKEINPGAINNFAGLANIVRKTEELLNYLLNKERLVIKEDDEFNIPIDLINLYPEREVLLYHLLKQFGYTAGQTKVILRTMRSQPGKYYESDKYVLVKDRNSFIISSKKDEKRKTEGIYIEPWQEYIISDKLKFTSEIKDYMPDFEMPRDKSFLALDYQKLEFPLKLRHWQNGDFFYPFGMKGRKKLSDFLIDIKMPLHKKDEVMVLLSGEDIVWVVNHRPDDRYVLKPTTSKIFFAKTYTT